MDESLNDVVSQIDESAAECCEDMRAKTAELYKQVEEYVRREPIKSLAITAAVGLVAGVLLSRR